tara:strand:+ start:3771 stop:3905 length:135 start_codon:yes stop_codon:yes gene_type:complete
MTRARLKHENGGMDLQLGILVFKAEIDTGEAKFELLSQEVFNKA